MKRLGIWLIFMGLVLIVVGVINYKEYKPKKQLPYTMYANSNELAFM